MLICQCLKLMLRHQFKYLRDNRITMSHGLIPLCYKVFLVDYIVTTEQGQAILASKLKGQ